MRMTMKFRDSLKRNTKKHKAYLRNTSSVSSKTAYSNICKTVQTRLRDMQDSWLRKKGWWNPVLCRQKGHEKVLRCTQDSIWSPELRNLSADETSLLTDKEAILKRWAEHFDGVLNRPSSINDEAIKRPPQVNLIRCLMSSQPSLKQWKQ